MTEPTFPEPQPIDWDALEEGDTVWMRAIVDRTLTDHPRKFVSQAYVYLDFHDPSEEVQAVRATTIRLGHVIKAPKPNLDMQCPDGVLDPAETAIFIRDLTAEIERLRAEVDTLRSALKLRVSNVSDDQIIAAWAAWDDCHEAPQANDAMRAALEASHLVFLRRTSQIVEATRAAQADQIGGEG
jgi:hypothetical protein